MKDPEAKHLAVTTLRFFKKFKTNFKRINPVWTKIVDLRQKCLLKTNSNEQIALKTILTTQLTILPSIETILMMIKAEAMSNTPAAVYTEL